jgi:hypothetical protein
MQGPASLWHRDQGLEDLRGIEQDISKLVQQMLLLSKHNSIYTYIYLFIQKNTHYLIYIYDYLLIQIIIQIIQCIFIFIYLIKY